MFFGTPAFSPPPSLSVAGGGGGRGRRSLMAEKGKRTGLRIYVAEHLFFVILDSLVMMTPCEVCAWGWTGWGRVSL